MLIPFRFLFVVGFVSAYKSDLCQTHCQTKFNPGTLFSACNKGCHFASGSPVQESFTDSKRPTVNVECATKCSIYGDNESRAACYEGCIFYPAAVVSKPLAGAIPSDDFFLFNILSSMLSNIFNPTDKNEVPPINMGGEPHLLRVRIIIPEGEGNPLVDDIPPRMLMPGMMDQVMGSMDGQRPMTADLPPMRPDQPEQFGFQHMHRLCHKTREFIHRVLSSPLFFALSLFLIFNVFFLLIFICLRCRARHVRSAAYKRQMAKIPAFFEPASVKVSLLKPQPASEEEEEATELPPKVPIV